MGSCVLSQQGWWVPTMWPCPHKVRVIYVHTVHTRTHAHTQSCRKCSVLTAGFTAAYSCLGVYLVLIWSIFGLGSHTMMIIIIKSMILVLQYWLLSFTFFLSIQFFTLLPFLFPFLRLSTRFPSLALFFILFLSLTLSLFVFVYVSRSLCEPGAQLRVRSQFPHREGLRDNRGCWQEISLGHAVPRAPLIRFPSKK